MAVEAKELKGNEKGTQKVPRKARPAVRALRPRRRSLPPTKSTAPKWVRSESYEFLGDEDISTDRYIEPSFAKEELDKLWTRTWQFACREENIPADRRLPRVRPRTLLVHHHPGRPERHSRLLQRLPASGHEAARLRQRGLCERVPVQLSRLELEHRRHQQECRLRLGLSTRRPQEVLAPRGEGGSAGRLRVHQHGSGRTPVG